TAEHPAYLLGQGWVECGKLKPGDTLQEIGGGTATVTQIRRERFPQYFDVYNFRVANAHTYFVRANGSDAEPVWVHNASTAYAKGSSGTNATVDAVAAEIEGATTRAEGILGAGGTGGTRWGRIYQRYAGTGTWRERIAYGNAVQQVADTM